MIVDRLENAGQYEALHRNFAKAFAFLNRPGLADLAEGRYEIDGQRVYATVARANARPREKALLEAHRKYIDIQLVLSGTDEMGWRSLRDCKNVQTPYDAEKDFVLYSDQAQTWVAVPPGTFAVFFPRDAHAPLVGAGELHKVVVKVGI